MNSIITGIVLAGGKSSRMKQDKSMLQYCGNTLLEHAVNILSNICKTVIISSHNKTYTNINCHICYDKFDNQAPIIGIYSCLIDSKTEYNFIIPCDMPFISQELLSYIISHIDDKHDAYVPMHDTDKKIEPLCAIYAKRSATILKEQIDRKDFKLKNCIELMNTQYIAINESLSFYNNNMFQNINNPEDATLLVSK